MLAVAGKGCDSERLNFQSNQLDLVGHFANIQIQEALTNSLRGSLAY